MTKYSNYFVVVVVQMSFPNARQAEGSVVDEGSTAQVLKVRQNHGLINYKDTKCRLHLYIIEFIDWRYSQLCWYFWPAL